MTKNYKNWLIAAVIIIAAALALLLIYFSNKNDTGEKDKDVTQKEDRLKGYLEKEDAIMSKMMQDMHDVPESGNASAHFLHGMIPHHESAVEMAESYLNYGGEDKELKQIAENIIDTQKKEILEMETMIQRIESVGDTDPEKEAGYLKEYNKMMASHHGSHSGHDQPDNVDKAFANGMIVHHQMAIDMSEAILKYTDDAELQTLARNIISAQEKEIQQMQEI